MTALIVIGAIILVIGFLLTRYAGIILKYSDDFEATVTYGFLRFPVGKPRRPKVKKEKKKKKKKKKKEDDAAPQDEEAPREDKRGKLCDTVEVILEMARKVKEILPKFFGKVHFKSARLMAKVATGDAASTAVACGGARAAASVLFETIDNFAVLERGSGKNVSIEPDYLSDKPTFDIEIRLRVRVIYAVAYGLALLWKFIKIKIKQERTKQ